MNEQTKETTNRQTRGPESDLPRITGDRSSSRDPDSCLEHPLPHPFPGQNSLLCSLLEIKNGVSLAVTVASEKTLGEPHLVL